MKKLMLLILLMMTSLLGFSQSVTDSTSIRLKKPIVKLVIKDLILGDGAKKELILTKISLRLFKEFRTHSKWMTITSFYNQIYDYLDKHIIKINLGSIMLITYAVPQQIATKLTIFSHAIIAVILPKISSQKKNQFRP